MASQAKHQRFYTSDGALDIFFEEGSKQGGTDSGKESKLDRELENFSGLSR